MNIMILANDFLIRLRLISQDIKTNIWQKKKKVLGLTVDRDFLFIPKNSFSVAGCS